MTKILIVDDDDQLRTSFAKLLREEGYEVVSAASGEAGLSSIVESRAPGSGDSGRPAAGNERD